MKEFTTGYQMARIHGSRFTLDLDAYPEMLLAAKSACSPPSSSSSPTGPSKPSARRSPIHTRQQNPCPPFRLSAHSAHVLRMDRGLTCTILSDGRDSARPCYLLSIPAQVTNEYSPARPGAGGAGTEGDQSIGEPSRRNGLLTPGMLRPPGVPMWPRLRADLWLVLTALWGVLRCAGAGVAPACVASTQESSKSSMGMAP